MIKTNSELVRNESYRNLATKKLTEFCKNMNLTVLSEYILEIAKFKASNKDPYTGKNKIFRMETAIREFYENHKEELDAIGNCQEEMRRFYEAYPEMK